MPSNFSASYLPNAFTHVRFGVLQGMNMDLAKKYAENVINIIQKGMDPPVTAIHARRIQTEALPPLMPKSMVKVCSYVCIPIL